jgi:heme exporter protein D
MHGITDGMMGSGSMWVWTIVGILLVVVLVIVIERLLRKS